MSADAEHGATGTGILKGLRVLVVEDRGLIASRIAQILEVGLPRPRSPADAAVGALFSRIEAFLTEASGRGEDIRP